jgi:hypothetical protein
MEKCKDFEVLKSLLLEGANYDLDLSELSQKLEEYITSSSEGLIKVVLLGSFSDGKTTAIAGLLNQLEDNMKIDEDESTDDLVVYYMDGLGHQYQIIDTPGLFGTEEKNINGKTIRISDITEKYISEAHIVIYVCNSVNTLKDSHKEVVKKNLREYGKLRSAIFVINKMDDVADTNDEEEYMEVSAIKKKTFTDRLKQVIGLTPDEEKQLKIACVSANPKGKGLHEWFTKKEEYDRRSHLQQLKEYVSSTIKESDIKILSTQVDEAVIKDIGFELKLSLTRKVDQLDEAVRTIKDSLDQMESDLAILKSDIIQNKGIMCNRIEQLRQYYNHELDNVGNLTAMGTLIEDEFGIRNDKIDFNILERKANQILEECCESNNSKIKANETTFKQQFETQNEILNKVLKGGLQGMHKVTGKNVLQARNLLFKGYKFKPWGAIKVAKNIGTAAAVIGVLLDAWDLYKKHQNNKKLNEIKINLKGILSTYFSDIFNMFQENDTYLKNFAPSCVELSKAVTDRKDELHVLEVNVISLKEYKKKIQRWFGEDIEDAVFEEIN